jgi:hypothetical protein
MRFYEFDKPVANPTCYRDLDCQLMTVMPCLAILMNYSNLRNDEWANFSRQLKLGSRC